MSLFFFIMRICNLLIDFNKKGAFKHYGINFIVFCNTDLQCKCVQKHHVVKLKEVPHETIKLGSFEFPKMETIVMVMKFGSGKVYIT